ncbi:MAG: EF-P beta-lysylation protein EpmB [Porticoccaceae bacterium]
MITQTSPQAIATWSSPQWKRELREAVTDSCTLLALLDLADSPLAGKVLASSSFPLRVPLPFVARMEKGNPHDPLLRQVLPVSDENLTPSGFVDDPLEESRFNPVPGIVHKYRGRVLLITTPVCAVNCRYCFRRHFPYAENTPGKQQWLRSLDYIRADSAIREVILSGGDPLATDDQHLAWLVKEIEKIPHVIRLRIHTRLPVVIPSRIDGPCLAWMGTSRLKLCVVLHINHANEIDAHLSAAAARMRALDIAVLNQAVLLRGVNDDAQLLADLSETLFDAGILPYYLHLLDPVSGGAHFETDAGKATGIYRELQAMVPGYLLPRLVRDVPGEASKTLVGLPM